MQADAGVDPLPPAAALAGGDVRLPGLHLSPSPRAHGRMRLPRPPRVAPWRRSRRGGGVQPSRGHAAEATGLRVPARGETPRCPVRLNGTLKPKILRGAVKCRLLELKDAVPIAPQPLVKQNL